MGGFCLKKFSNYFFAFVLLLSFWSISSNVKAATVNSHTEGINYLIGINALTSSADTTASVTRAQFASFITKSLKLEKESPVTFSDVAINDPAYIDIRKAVEAGIVTGYTNGTFKPNDPISRVHMAVMLNRMLAYQDIQATTTALPFKDNAAILPEYQEAVAVGAHYDIIQGKQGFFLPHNHATVAQAATFVVRTMKVIDPDLKVSEVKPTEKPAPQPTPPATTGKYVVKEVQHGQLITRASYPTLTAARAAMASPNEVVMVNNKIIEMKSGFAVTNKYIAYRSETINDQLAVAENTELEFLSSDGVNAKVRLSGQLGTVSLNDLTLIPFSLAKGRAYYANVNGELVHYLYKHSANQFYASYTIGKAPSFMQPGQKYYSWNGMHFTGNGTSQEAYNYYQFLPARTQTNYTAAELDEYIMKQLRSLDANGGIWVNGVQRQDIAQRSKLIGLGSTLKEIEQRYQINALLILSLAQHESAYGMSKHAQELNNLFGLYVYDTNPLNKKFDSIKANIDELVNKFLQPNYLTPTGPYANGGVVGSKAVGFNMKYASDPFWGAKIAGHYYRADKTMGFKDANQPYTIGFTTSAVPIRTVATLYNNTPLFTHKRAGMPVAITSDNIADWYEILSDQYHSSRAYVPKANVRIVPTTK